MATEEQILSNDEREAILDASDDDKANVDDVRQEGMVELLDFVQDQKLANMQFNGFNAINELLSLEAAHQFGKLLHKKVRVQALQPRVASYGHYIQHNTQACAYNLLALKSLNSLMMININRKLISAFINVLFGGVLTEESCVVTENFGKIEERISLHIVDIMMNSLAQTWDSLGDFSYETIKTVAVSNAIKSIPHEESIIVSEYMVDIQGTVGEIYLCWHRGLLNSLKGNIKDSAQKVIDDQEKRAWQSSLQSNVYEAPLRLIAGYPDIHCRFKDLVNLSVGDILPIDNPEEINIYIEDFKLFRGKCGTANGARAVEINNQIKD